MKGLRRAQWILLSLLLAAASASAATPERAKGISMHLLPKRVADISGGKWGLTVTRSGDLTMDEASATLQTGAEFRAFVRKQNKAVLDNGVWIVVTNPDAYSKAENALIEEVNAICAEQKLPLFVCRASELPNGWKRWS